MVMKRLCFLHLKVATKVSLMKTSEQANRFYLLAIVLVTFQFFAYVTFSQSDLLTDPVNGPARSSVIVTVLYSELLSALEIGCSILIFFYLHDYTLLKRRQQIGDSASLDREGIQYINQNFQLETVIIHEDEDCQPPKRYQHSSSQYTASSFHNERQQFELYQRDFEEILEGVPRRGETFLKVSTLTHLPLLSHQHNREQVGLFAQQDIPEWSLFYWIGDIHIIHNSERQLLSSAVKMNRRTLATFDEISFFQGGDLQQRSGFGVLANFFWCHTHSTPSDLSPYWILPFHFLGEANCVYVTTKREGYLCSALLAFKEIKADEQILMFTGSEEEVRMVERRIKFYKMIPTLAGCSLGLTLIKSILLWL